MSVLIEKKKTLTEEKSRDLCVDCLEQQSRSLDLAVVDRGMRLTNRPHSEHYTMAKNIGDNEQTFLEKVMKKLSRPDARDIAIVLVN